MENGDRILVLGASGMVGSAIAAQLRVQGHTLITPSSKDVDLTNQEAVRWLFRQAKPDYVFLAAAKVGGILANSTQPAAFIFSNLAIQTNVMEAAYKANVKKLLFLGSSCIYPRACPQPIKEEYLLTGPLEPTNEAYAIAKIAGIKMAQAFNKQLGTRFISVMPTNLYGPGDHYDLQNSHVLPALLRRFHEAKASGAEGVTLWGTGVPKREFLHVSDLASACLMLMESYEGSDPINVGSGEEVSIYMLALTIAVAVGYEGGIAWDSSKPDGTPRKLLDSSRMRALGWAPSIGLEEGIRSTYLNHCPFR